MTRAAGIEREAKFTAWPGFVLPDLDGLHDGVTAGPPSDEVLEAVYYDAKDLRLIRAGVTLRHRSGRTGAVWTVKFPQAPTDDGSLRRREVDLVLPSGPPPAEVVALVRAYLRTGELVPVALLQTRRRRIELLDGDHVLAEVDDDEVSVLDGEHVAARFREVEAEITPDAPEALLGALVERLREAGAGAPDPTPKLVRALGPRALQAPDLVEVELGSSPSAADLVHTAFSSSVMRIVENDPIVRLDDDPEGVHQARVGARRLRSDLDTFGPLLAGEWADALRDELRWLGQQLGAVRDADVLLARLESDADTLSREVDRDAARALLNQLADQRAEALREAVEALSSPRYAALIEQLVGIALHPPLKAKADAKASKVVPALVAKPYKVLAKAIDGMPRDPHDDELHSIRKKAKRARYAAEAAAPVIGAPAARLARALKHLQDVLGDHQDAVVAEGWLRDAAAEVSPEQAMAAGLLISRQRNQADRLRDQWLDAWQDATTKKLTGWLR